MGFRGKAERLRRRGSIKGGALIGAIVLLSPSAIHSPARTSPESLPPTCNGTWTVVPSPNPTQQSALLQDVVAVSANDAWAVGNYSNSDGVFLTLAEHWDGSSWSIVSTPNVGSVYDQLYGVSALGSDDVWAVGSTEGPSGRIHTLAEHWDGVSWTVVPTPPTPNQATSLAGVNVISPANVWAVGKTTTRGSSHRLRIRYTTGTLIEHWDGHAWSIVPNPMSGAVLAELWSVSDRKSVV